MPVGVFAGWPFGPPMIRGLPNNVDRRKESILCKSAHISRPLVRIGANGRVATVGQ